MTLTPPEQTLANIRIRCERLIDAAGDALAEPLCDAENADSPEVRTILTGALAATKRLRDHIDANYECSTGFAEPKEGDTCPD
jgi:hypothetical protein